RRPRWAGGDGARPASRADAHVYRSGSRGPLRDRREPGGDRAVRTAGRRAGTRCVSDLGEPCHHPTTTTDSSREGTIMLLATTRVEDFDRFMKVFSGAGAEKRKQHGSKGAVIFHDPAEADRVWVVFDWDEKGWQSFVSD